MDGVLSALDHGRLRGVPVPVKYVSEIRRRYESYSSPIALD